MLTATPEPNLHAPAAGYDVCNVERWRGAQHTAATDYVVDEQPVALIYNGVPHAVMLTTPVDLDDFVLGFSLSENIIAHADELTLKELRRVPDGTEAWLKIPGERFRALSGRERGLAGRSGCGLCGVSQLHDAIRPIVTVENPVTLANSALRRALAELHDQQVLNRLTGAVHAAAWANCAGEIGWVREDVGRHNALDKLLGVLARQSVNVADGFCIVTSRASYEMVQKATRLGIGLLVAISAPTALAVRLAHASQLTLIGFARGDTYNVYTHPQRLLNHG